MSAWANEKRPATLADSSSTEAATACSSSSSSSSSECSVTREQEIDVESRPITAATESASRASPEPFDPTADHLAHALRKAELGEAAADRPPSVARLIERAGLDQVAQELAGVEGVSVGLAVELARQPRAAPRRAHARLRAP